jgi:ADP-heptose:LPS heptosyltransferase
LANPTPESRRPRLLALELWGLGDLALAVPFLRAAARQADVTLLAKPGAAGLLRRFVPGVDLIVLDAPWTAFRGKYRLHRWPWSGLRQTLHELRRRQFDIAVSARPDPRDHLLMRLSGTRRRLGYPRLASGLLLSQAVQAPLLPHRAEHWRAMAGALGWEPEIPVPPPRTGRHLVIHTGAAQAVREWPRERFDALADHLRSAGWRVTLLDNSLTDLDRLLEILAGADRFIGNDSGPGHLAALLGVPTFTIFGPQLPERFAPQHPQAAWTEGAPCPHKPCSDYCRFPVPHCIRDISLATVRLRVDAWLRA